MPSEQALRGLVYKVGAVTAFAFILAVVAVAMSSGPAPAPTIPLFSAAASAAGLNVLYSDTATIVTTVDTADDLLNAFQAM